MSSELVGIANVQGALLCKGEREALLENADFCSRLNSA